jgi:hypothetical protein
MYPDLENKKTSFRAYGYYDECSRDAQVLENTSSKEELDNNIP